MHHKGSSKQKKFSTRKYLGWPGLILFILFFVYPTSWVLGRVKTSTENYAALPDCRLSEKYTSTVFKFTSYNDYNVPTEPDCIAKKTSYGFPYTVRVVYEVVENPYPPNDLQAQKGEIVTKRIYRVRRSSRRSMTDFVNGLFALTVAIGIIPLYIKHKNGKRIIRRKK